ncbi:MAG: hypothetical protein JSV99_03805 [Planctomycetota bacterium]|nr:MAG: hypothetical protein JSV99_03805 [Planctomycetota bacterium]
MNEPTDQGGKLERITRRWWFFLVFVLLQFTVPPYASKGYEFPDEWSDVAMQAIGNCINLSYSKAYPGIKPVFKIIPIVLIISVIIFRNKVARLFSIYVAISYVIFAFGQGIGVTEKYGLAVSTVTLIMFLIVAAFWVWEVVALKNDFNPRKQPIWKYWVFPLALLAFWYPLNPQTGGPDFKLAYIFGNIAGLAFCTMTPLYIGLLTLYYPKINIVTLRITSLVGVSTGIANMFINFLVNPSIRWWNGVLHIPLLTISIYGLIISLKRPILAGDKAVLP